MVHLGQIQSGLRAAIRIVQGSHIKIHMNSEVPVQVQTVEKKRITEKAPTRAISWLKVPTSTFTFKTLLRHYAKQAPKHGK